MTLLDLARPMTPLPRAPLLAAALLLATAISGCTDTCAPVEVPTVVSLGLTSEEVRTLPILVSGATRIAGEDVPDAHGRLEIVVDVAHPGNSNETLNFTDVTISNLRLGIEVDGAPVPVEVLKVEGAGAWTRVGPNSWSGGAVSSTRIVLWWTVDADRLAAPLALALREGAPYRASVDFDWTHRDCYAKASGRAQTSFEDFVQASANARTFAPQGEPRIEVTATGAGLRADYRVTSGLNVTMRGVEMRAVRLGPPAADVSANASGGLGGGLGGSPTGVAGDAGADLQGEVAVGLGPGVALVVFPTTSWLAEGAPSPTVGAAQTLRVQSATTEGDYAASGLMLPAAFADGPGVFIVHVRITYAPDDPTLGVTTDTFAHLVVRT